MNTTQAMDTPQWIELRSHNRLWARYNPSTHTIELARQDVRVVFDLRKYQRQRKEQQQRQAVVGG